jgi:hypothetical protein
VRLVAGEKNAVMGKRKASCEENQLDQAAAREVVIPESEGLLADVAVVLYVGVEGLDLLLALPLGVGGDSLDQGIDLRIVRELRVGALKRGPRRLAAAYRRLLPELARTRCLSRPGRDRRPSSRAPCPWRESRR